MNTANVPAPRLLKIPKLVVSDAFIAAQPKKIFSNGHVYHINSISTNSDGETYLSADDLRINLWNFNIHDQSFSKSINLYIIYGFWMMNEEFIYEKLVSLAHECQILWTLSP
jgi:hypothetical protein